MSNTSKLKITGDYSDSKIRELLVGKHVKFKYEGWAKVYQVNILRTPRTNTVVLSINENVTLYPGLKKFISEESPDVVVKNKKWWKLW